MSQIILKYIVININSAMLNWLKEEEDNLKASFNSTKFNNNDDINASTDLFLVRNYIMKYSLMSGLSQKEVADLTITFPFLHTAFDIETLMEEFIYCSGYKLACVACKKTFLSHFEILDNPECKGEMFHPRIIRNEKNICLHENCHKKINKNDLPCCHKGVNSNGCMHCDGRHIIVIENII
jgi:hypothetical protein